jgi:hypothetical protein
MNRVSFRFLPVPVLLVLSVLLGAGGEHAGAATPGRGHEIINSYSLAFFDKYLKGKGGDLLKQMPSPFPEVDFAKK